MILVDTSVWIDHFRAADTQLVNLLDRTVVLMHPLIVGELACGNLANRESKIELLSQLPVAAVAEHDEVLRFISARKLFGKGIGLIDAHLLASVAISGDQLWTRDKRLRAMSLQLGSGTSYGLIT